MGLINIPLTREDYEQADWQAVIAGCEPKDCRQYEYEFAIKANIAKSEGNEKAQEVFSILQALSSLVFRLDDKKQPLACAWVVFDTGRSAALDDISDSHLDVLKEIVTDIFDADMRARIADALWIRRRGDFQYARLAIAAYLESTTALVNEPNSPAFPLRIERALQLAFQIRHVESIQAAVAHIEKLIDQYSGTTPTFIQTKMMQLLEKYRQGDPAKYTTLAAREAERMETEGATEAARMFWEIKAGFHAANEEQDEELRQTRIRIAETYVTDANNSVACSDFGSATHHLIQAIEAYRRCGSCQTQVNDLHRRLLECQRKLPMQMGRDAVPFDPRPFWEPSRQAVKGKSLVIALRELASLSSSPNIAQLREITEDALQNTIMSIIPMEMLNEQGTTIARSEAADDETDAEKVIRNHMFRQVVWHYNLVVTGQIQPALGQITLEHSFRPDDLLPLLKNNPFVPPGREFLYAKGLYAGLHNEWAEAVHILIPQIEHSLRYLLSLSGVVTSGLDSEAIQDEYDLNKMLRMPETNKLLGEDIVFDLRGLLVEKWGVNFRNRMAHGLFDPGAFYSVYAIYTWWITLRLCVGFLLGFLHALQQEHMPSEEGTGQKHDGPRESPSNQ